MEEVGVLMEGVTNLIFDDNNAAIGTTTEYAIEKTADFVIDRSIPGPTPKITGELRDLYRTKKELIKIPITETVNETINKK